MNPDTHINRRDVLSLGIAGLAIASFGVLVDRARTHVTRLSSDQENYLKAVLQENPKWRDCSHRGAESYEARTSHGANIAICRQRTSRTLVLSISVTDADKPFTFRCPFHSVDVRERELLMTLFEQARGSCFKS
jgi:hypothetical protein